jgi:hypothetical protein
VVALTAGACGHGGPEGKGPDADRRQVPKPAVPTGGKAHGKRIPTADKRVTSALAGITDGIEPVKAPHWRLSVDERYIPLLRWPKDGRVRRVSEGQGREGKYKLRFEIAPRPRSFRAEIARPVVPMGSDCWYGFSIFLPANWQRDRKGSIMAQWHARVGRQVPNFPNAALYVLDDKWWFRTNWNTRGDTSRIAGWRKKSFRLGPVRKGVWTDWVLHGKWSTKRDGRIGVWQDGRQVIDHHGPTTYVNDTGPYFKMGLYHPTWRHADAKVPAGSKTLVSYADAVRLSCAAGQKTGGQEEGRRPR